MRRVTEKELQAIVDRINDMTNSPQTTYSKVDGKYIANIGNYHLSFAYGGVQLQRMMGLNGGVTAITSGYISKRELSEKLYSYINGIQLGKELKQ